MPKNSDFQGLYCFSYSLIAHLPLRKGCWMLSPLHNFLQNCLSQVQVCSQTHQPCECKEKAIFPLTQPWEKCLGILQYQEGCWSWMELSGKVQYYPPPPNQCLFVAFTPQCNQCCYLLLPLLAPWCVCQWFGTWKVSLLEEGKSKVSASRLCPSACGSRAWPLTHKHNRRHCPLLTKFSLSCQSDWP